MQCFHVYITGQDINTLYFWIRLMINMAIQGEDTSTFDLGTKEGKQSSTFLNCSPQPPAK